MDNRKNFIPRNEGFVCERCSQQVPPAKVTFRNHCPFCLSSKHVDIVPGDRLESCHGLMTPIGIEGTDPDKLDIIHECKKCHKIQRNRTAPDDNKEIIFTLLTDAARRHI